MMNMKEKKEYYKNMIYRIGLISSVKNNDINDYNEFPDLFKNHPEYPQKIDGIIDVRIVKNMRNPKCYELNIIKEDGSIDDISYLSCCQVQHDKMKNLKSAMRYAIQPQIDNYRSKNVNVCQSCNSSKNIEIDHLDPSFKTLCTDFIATNPNFPKEFQDTYFNSACFKKEDREFEGLWYDYHRTHAKLQCLCKKCNLSKNVKKNTFHTISKTFF